MIIKYGQLVRKIMVSILQSNRIYILWSELRTEKFLLFVNCNERHGRVGPMSVMA